MGFDRVKIDDETFLGDVSSAFSCDFHCGTRSLSSAIFVLGVLEQASTLHVTNAVISWPPDIWKIAKIMFRNVYSINSASWAVPAPQNSETTGPQSERRNLGHSLRQKNHQQFVVLHQLQHNHIYIYIYILWYKYIYICMGKFLRTH